MDKVTSMPKTDTFRFRINPDIRQEIEEIYAKSGLTLTQAINIFIQQSINAGGLPFPVTADNAEFLRAKSLERLMKELETGKRSGDLIDEQDVCSRLGVEL
ncbi:MAG: type II toxin-antitoxin system RelB/DinJ family antitoxin [Ruminococcus sp.]|nr:type II toxin-antitoxin system RelB/DinJ family antitoxin [Ruminococcus sp.]